MMFATHPLEVIGTVLDRPRKAYVEHVRKGIVHNCDHTLKLLTNFQRRNGNNLISGHIVRNVNDIKQIFIIVRQRAQAASSLSALREVRNHLHEMDIVVDALTAVHHANVN